MSNSSVQRALDPPPAPRRAFGFEVAMSPCWWKNVSALRTFIGSFLRPVLPQPAMADHVALVAHELLENALKYSATRESPVRCRTFIHRDRVRLRVQNRATPEAIGSLREVFALVHLGDPESAYLAMMHRSLASDDTSQLGLARIRYETGARLGLRVVRDTVSIDADFTFTTPKGA